MCGRYAATANPDDLVEEFEVDETDPSVTAGAATPDYNVAPTKAVPAVLERRRRDDAGQPAGEPVRRLTAVRWGLVPSWAKDPGIGNRLINARAESLADKPAFRRAFARRRCVLPATGYYEWRAPDGPGRKQPFFIRPRDGHPLALAGLYEIWRDPSVPEDDPSGLLWSATIITTDANADVAGIHDRMPVVIRSADVSRWLDPTFDDPGAVADLLAPLPTGLLEAFPVSPAVNNVRNNSAELIEPLPAEESEEPDGDRLF